MKKFTLWTLMALVLILSACASSDPSAYANCSANANNGEYAYACQYAYAREYGDPGTDRYTCRDGDPDVRQ